MKKFEFISGQVIEKEISFSEIVESLKLPTFQMIKRQLDKSHAYYFHVMLLNGTNEFVKISHASRRNNLIILNTDEKDVSIKSVLNCCESGFKPFKIKPSIIKIAISHNSNVFVPNFKDHSALCARPTNIEVSQLVKYFSNVPF